MARKNRKADDARSKAEAKESASSKKKATESIPAKPGPPKSVWREYFESAIYTAIMFVFFITFIGRTVGVPTGSMQNTIVIGDHFLINKFVFAPGSHPFFLPQRDIRRGDIIVFKYPGDNYNPGRDEDSKRRWIFVTIRRAQASRTPSITKRARCRMVQTKLRSRLRSFTSRSRSLTRFHPTTTSSWATTATIAPTAAHGEQSPQTW
ncbi:MAG: hypothetical protein DMF68_03250 [Acidobacteria bacterium]|nr:MAG: hypothetical protein DMF68_03250 [Acidobacteriota bacterium]